MSSATVDRGTLCGHPLEQIAINQDSSLESEGAGVLSGDARSVLLMSRVFTGATLRRHFTVEREWSQTRIEGALSELMDAEYGHIIFLDGPDGGISPTWILNPYPITRAELLAEINGRSLSGGHCG